MAAGTTTTTTTAVAVAGATLTLTISAAATAAAAAASTMSGRTSFHRPYEGPWKRYSIVLTAGVASQSQQA